MFGSNYFGQAYFAEGFANPPNNTTPTGPVLIAHPMVGPMALRYGKTWHTIPTPQQRNINQNLNASLTFTGAITKNVVESSPFIGGLSFTGIVPTKAVTYILTGAGLSFTGSATKSPMHNLSGSLSFTGSIARTIGKALSGALNFTVNFVPGQAVTFVINATLSFAGSITKATSHNLSGGLSFAGSAAKKATKALSSATLSFVGAITKPIGKTFSGGLSFTGAFLIPTVTFIITASLSFTGSINKRVSKKLTGSVGFLGSLIPRRLRRVLGNLWHQQPKDLKGSCLYDTAVPYDNSTTQYDCLPSSQLSPTYPFYKNLFTKQTVKSVTWNENPAYLASSILYNSATLYDAAKPYNGSKSSAIPPNYPTYSNKWTKQASKQTDWSQNKGYLTGSVTYNNASTTYDAALPYDGTTNVAPTSSISGTIWEEFAE